MRSIRTTYPDLKAAKAKIAELADSYGTMARSAKTVRAALIAQNHASGLKHALQILEQIDPLGAEPQEEEPSCE